MSIFTLVYRSVPVIAGTVPDYIGEVDHMLATARRRNPSDDVTGVLLFNEDWFVQLLEGDEHAVISTYERIALDPRHEDLQVLHSGWSSGRRFPEWSMAFVGDAAALRERFADSPLACSDLPIRGDDLLDHVVALARISVVASD